MKRIATSALLLLLCMTMVFSFAACADVEQIGLWESATHVRDKSFGKGDSVLTVLVTAEEQTLTFTIKTDKDNLGDALREHELIEDENGLVHTVNGMGSSYEEGGWYWKLTKDGAELPASINDVKVANGEQYKFAVEKYDAIAKTGVWADAKHVNCVILGTGSKTLTVSVTAETQTLTFTIKTDKTTLREAMEEHQLISGEESQFGLYVKVVNGITADYNDGGYWWGINVNGESSMYGVDGIEVADGANYEFIRTNTY